MGRSELEAHILKPHERHPDPHPQYKKRGSGSLAELTTATPSVIGIHDSAEVGTAITAARADHRHGSPPLATASRDGFMSAADKAKLDLLYNAPVVPATPILQFINKTELDYPGTLYYEPLRSYLTSAWNLNREDTPQRTTKKIFTTCTIAP